MQSVSQIYRFHLLMDYTLKFLIVENYFIKINSETYKCLAPVYLRTKE